MRKLSDICDIKAGGTPSRSIQSYWSNGSIPWVKISDFNGKYLSKTEEFITEDGLKHSSAKLFSKGTILFTIFATLGEVCILDIDAATNQAIAGISIKDKSVHKEYLFYYLLSLKGYVNNIGRGVAQNNINMSILRNFEIRIPSIEEQKKVSEQLDKISGLIMARKRQIIELDNLVKSRFIEMFGDPVDNPYGLNTVYLKELSSLITKGASPSWQGFSYTDDNSQTLFVTSENVREGYMDFSSEKYIEDGFNAKQKRSVLQKKDFLINIVGASIGRAAQFNLDCKANINQAVALVRLKPEKVNESYLLCYLNSEKALQMYNSMKSDVARANLSLEDIGNLSIILPPINLQNEFATFVEQVDKSKSAIKKSLEEMETLYKSLLQKYFG